MNAHGRCAHQFVHRTPGVYVRRRMTQTTRVDETRVTWKHFHGYHPYIGCVPVRVDLVTKTTTTTTCEENVFVHITAKSHGYSDKQLSLVAHLVVEGACSSSTAHVQCCAPVRNDMNETCAPIPTNLQSLTYEGPHDVHCFKNHQNPDGGPKIEDDEDAQVRIKQESLSPRLGDKSRRDGRVKLEKRDFNIKEETDF